MLKSVSVSRILVLLLLLVVSVSLYSCGSDTPSGGNTQSDDGSGDDGSGDGGSGDDIVAKTPTIVSDPSNKAVLSWGDAGTTVTYTFSIADLPDRSYVGLSSDEQSDEGGLFQLDLAKKKILVDKGYSEASFTVTVSPYSSLSLGETETLTATVYNGSRNYVKILVDGKPLTASIDVQLKEYPAGTAPRISFVHPEKYIQYFSQSSWAATSKVNYTIEFENLPPDSVISLSTKYQGVFEKGISYSKPVSGSGTITLPKSLSSSFKAGYNSTLVASVSARQGMSNRTVLDSSGEHLQASVDVVSVKASSIKVVSSCDDSLFLGDKGSTREYTFGLTDIPEGGGFLYLNIENNTVFENLSRSDAIVEVDGGNSTVTYSLKVNPMLAADDQARLNATLYLDSGAQRPYYIGSNLTYTYCSPRVQLPTRVRIDSYAQEIPLNSKRHDITVWANSIPESAVVRLTTSSNNIVKSFGTYYSAKEKVDKNLATYKYSFIINTQDLLSLGDKDTLTATVYRDEDATTPMIGENNDFATDSLEIRVREIPVKVFSPTSLYSPMDISSDQTGQVISYEFDVSGVPSGGGYARLDLNPESKIFASVGNPVFVSQGDSKIALTATTKDTLTVDYKEEEEMTVSLYADSSFSAPLLDANNYPAVWSTFSKMVSSTTGLLASSESSSNSLPEISSYYSYTPSIPPVYAGKVYQVLFKATSLPKGSVVRLTSDDDGNVISKILTEKIVMTEDYTGVLSFDIKLAGRLASGSAVQLTATAYENEDAEQPMKISYGYWGSYSYEVSSSANLKIESTGLALSTRVDSHTLVSIYNLSSRVDYSFNVYGVPTTSILELSPLSSSKMFPPDTINHSSLGSGYLFQQGFRAQLNLARGVILPGDEAKLVAKVYSDASKATLVYDSTGRPLEMIIRTKVVGHSSIFVHNPVIEIPINNLSKDRTWVFPVRERLGDVRINKQSTSNTLVTEANTFRSDLGILRAWIRLNENLKVGDEEILRIAAYGSRYYGSDYILSYQGRNIETLVTIKIVE